MWATWFSYAFFLGTGQTPKKNIYPRTWTKFINISWKLGGAPSAWKFLHQINQGFTFLFAQQVLQELVAVAPTVGDRPGYFMHSTVACIVCICVFGELPKSNFWKQKKGTCTLYPEGFHPSQTRGNCYQLCKSPHRWIQRTVFACEKESKTARCPLVVLVIMHPPALSGLVAISSIK